MAVARSYPEFSGFGQQDAAQFLDVVLGGMDTEAQNICKIPMHMSGPAHTVDATETNCADKHTDVHSVKPTNHTKQSVSRHPSIVADTCTGRLRSVVRLVMT